MIVNCRAPLCLSALALTLAACGDDSGGRDSLSTGITTLSTGDSAANTETSDSGMSASGGDMGTSTGDGDGDDTAPPCMGGSEVESLIWIANSGEGTVSKIDTVSGVELGRYIVRSDSAGSPSRTSVNNAGDVAVANRLGGVTVVRAREENCVESNGIPDIQTSTGPADVLPWGQDECVAWHAAIPHTDNRPIAWTAGYADPDTCTWIDRDVWTGWSDGALGTAAVALLDGNSGATIAEIPMPDLPEAHPNWFGFYGGAVDKDDNFWASQLQGGMLVKVNRSDFSYELIPTPAEGGYGMTVTPDGYVWLCGRSTHRYDPETGSWQSSNHFAEPDSIHTGGCMGDGDNLLWRGAYGSIMAVDVNSLALVKSIPVAQAGDDFIWGVALDYDQMTTRRDQRARRVAGVDARGLLLGVLGRRTRSAAGAALAGVVLVRGPAVLAGPVGDLGLGGGLVRLGLVRLGLLVRVLLVLLVLADLRDLVEGRLRGLDVGVDLLEHGLGARLILGPGLERRLDALDRVLSVLDRGLGAQFLVLARLGAELRSSLAQGLELGVDAVELADEATHQLTVGRGHLVDLLVTRHAGGGIPGLGRACHAGVERRLHPGVLGAQTGDGLFVGLPLLHLALRSLGASGEQQDGGEQGEQRVVELGHGSPLYRVARRASP